MLLLKLIEILPNIGSHSGHIRDLSFIYIFNLTHSIRSKTLKKKIDIRKLVSKITGTERKVLEGGGSEAPDKGSQVVGNAELLEVLRRRGGR